MKKTDTILDKIVAVKLKELAALKKQKPLSVLKRTLSDRKTLVRDFYGALAAANHLNIIAEIKKSSPSEGLIRGDFDHRKIANDYQASGLVDAISILTESNYFKGDLRFIKDVKDITSVPTLRKDFLFDEYQIYESYLAEADAILLIVSLLSRTELQRLLQIATQLGLHCLVEVHSKAELEIALNVDAKIIGINARDLKTFELNSDLFGVLVGLIPEDVLKVAESGLNTTSDLAKVRKQGADAVLIGSSIMRSTNIQNKLTQLVIGGDI